MVILEKSTISGLIKALEKAKEVYGDKEIAVWKEDKWRPNYWTLKPPTKIDETSDKKYIIIE